MSDSITTIRNQFIDPPMSHRHLVIIHQFSRRRRAGGPEGGFDVGASHKEAIMRWLPRLVEWGFGGIVTNVGGQDYLEDEQEWEVFLAGVAAARELGLRVWIYDEQGYPSGAAGGIVLRDHPEYEAQGLVRMQAELGPGEVEMRPPTGWLYCVRAEARLGDEEEPVDISGHVGADGFLRFDTPARCSLVRYDARRAFEGTHASRNVFRVRRYINVLQQEAVEYFFHVTDERYLERLGQDARLIEAVFTDEPSFMTAYFPDLPGELQPKLPPQDEPDPDFDRLPMVPWEARLPARFRERWGYDLTLELGRLYNGGSPRDLRVRHDFHQLVSEMYEQAFFGMQQERLQERGIAFSGHALAEESIVLHVACQGNLIADLKRMGIPGIDMLSSVGEHILDTSRLLTCKYAASAARAAGREQMMSESSDWEQRCVGKNTDWRERRGALAVQMALGVTTIASYYDWHVLDPLDVRRLLDFCARLAVVVRNGTRLADIAVLYPIRTAWAYYKPTDQVISPAHMDEPLLSMDDHLHTVARTIIGAGLDFDFVEPGDLAASAAGGGKLRVGDAIFSVLIIPPGTIMCPRELDAVERFASAGGRVLALEPCSEFAMPETTVPSLSREPGCGRSPADVLAALMGVGPDRVRRFAIEDEWVDFAAGAASQDIRIEMGGTYLVARRSVFQNTDFVFIANGSTEDADAIIRFDRERDCRTWNPEDGSESAAIRGRELRLTVPGYSGLVVVSAK